MTHRKGQRTRALDAGYHADRATGAVAPPIYQTATFVFDSAEQGAVRFAHQKGG